MLFILAVQVLLLSLRSVQGEEQLLMILGGGGTPQVSLINQVCDKKCDVAIPDVPQPYGSPGRKGSYAVSLNDSVIVCGGLDYSGPPISSFRDCQSLHLPSLSWSPGPAMANYSALGVSAKISRTEYLVFGGLHTRSSGGPTEWVEHDDIQELSLSEDRALDWRLLPSKTYQSDPLLDSCAVSLEDGSVLVVTKTQILNFSPQLGQWSIVELDVGVNGYSLGQYSCAKVRIDGEMFVVVINLESPFAFSPSSHSIIMLPTPLNRSEKPLVTVVGTEIIIHGNSEPSFEESLGKKPCFILTFVTFCFHRRDSHYGGMENEICPGHCEDRACYG